MGAMSSRRKQTRTPRLVASARRNLARAQVARIGRRGTRYFGTMLPKQLRILVRSKQHD